MRLQNQFDPIVYRAHQTPFEVSQTSSVHSSDRFSKVCVFTIFFLYKTKKPHSLPTLPEENWFIKKNIVWPYAENTYNKRTKGQAEWFLESGSLWPGAKNVKNYFKNNVNKNEIWKIEKKNMFDKCHHYKYLQMTRYKLKKIHVVCLSFYI